MKGALRWVVKGVVILVLLVVIGVVAIYGITNSRMEQTREVPFTALEIPTDEEAIAWGKHLAESRGCTDCHAPDFGGQLFIDAGPVAKLSSSNLTSGDGGIAGLYDDASWARAIRHGVNPDGRPLLFMPSYEYYFFSDRDLASLVAYMKTVAPVDRINERPQIGPVGRVLYLLGQFPLLPVEMIDHTAPRPEPEPAETVEYGRYLSVGCSGCHGPDLSGGKIPGSPPDWPPAANLTPFNADGVAGWTEAQFFTAMRTGVRPDGRELETPYFPLAVVSRLSDLETRALYLYLKTLPAAE